jgi:glycosyltransferase involved in cell wall biosynthesis
MIDILIPTLERPHKVARLVANIAEATELDHRVWFIVEDFDTPTIDAVHEVGLTPIINRGAPNYAGAINTGYRCTDGDLLFAGADDIKFHPGWDHTTTGHMDDWIGVVGTNDLFNQHVLDGLHSTHYLVSRRYLDLIGGVVDEGPGSFLNEIYSHNYTDTEFIGTAKARARFRPCLEAIVEHLHTLSGKGEPPDSTTEKAMSGWRSDERIYMSRLNLWWELSK